MVSVVSSRNVSHCVEAVVDADKAATAATALELLNVHIVERPAIAVLGAKHMDAGLCFHCFKRLPMAKLRCACDGNCGVAKYCSEACRVRDWQYGHSHECEVFAAIVGDAETWQRVCAATALRLVARGIVRSVRDRGRCSPDDVDGLPRALPLRHLWSLRYFGGVIEEDDYWAGLALFRDAYQKHSSFFARVTERTFKGIYAVLPNAFYIQPPDIFNSKAPWECANEETAMGAGLYPQARRFAHGCDPDLTHYFDDATLVVKNVKPLPKDCDLNQLTLGLVGYASILPVQERKMIIGRLLGYECCCSLCSDVHLFNLQAYSVAEECTWCSAPLIVPWGSRLDECYMYCSDCRHLFPVDDTLRLRINAFSAAYRDHEDGKRPFSHMESARKLLKQGEAFLHPSKNLYLAKIRFELVKLLRPAGADGSVDDDDADEVAALLAGLLATCEDYGIKSLLVARLRFRLGRIYQRADRALDAARQFEQAAALSAYLIDETHHSVQILRRQSQQLKQRAAESLQASESA